MLRFAVCLVLLFAVSVLPVPGVQAQTPAVDLRGVRDSVAGGPTEVLVLGTPHLSALGDRFEPGHLGPLLDRLAAFAPDVITVESVPGMTCDLLVLYSEAHLGVADRFCFDPTEAREATGLTGPEADAEVRATLASWPDDPTPAQRRRLAAAFLASGDPTSALVQWLHLPTSERRAGDGLDAALADDLARRAASPNENSQIAARLAVRLGHERVVPADDHSAASALAHVDDLEASQAAISAAWAEDAGGFQVASDSAMAALGSAQGLLSYYRYVNAPRTQVRGIETDFRANLREPSPERYGRGYVSYWQVRNLRMVAHIVSAGTRVPGGRVLSIVGAQHKPYFDAYLDLMHDVEVVDAASVLG